MAQRVAQTSFQIGLGCSDLLPNRAGENLTRILYATPLNKQPTPSFNDSSCGTRTSINQSAGVACGTCAAYMHIPLPDEIELCMCDARTRSQVECLGLPGASWTRGGIRPGRTRAVLPECRLMKRSRPLLLLIVFLSTPVGTASWVNSGFGSFCTTVHATSLVLFSRGRWSNATHLGYALPRPRLIWILLLGIVISGTSAQPTDMMAPSPLPPPSLPPPSPPPGPPVWCGSHSATMCQNCPWTPNDNIRSGWAGAGWCGGDCVWDYALSTCNPPPSPPSPRPLLLHVTYDIAPPKTPPSAPPTMPPLIPPLAPQSVAPVIRRHLSAVWEGPFADTYLGGYCSPSISEATLEAAQAAVEVTGGCNGITKEPSSYTGRAGTTLKASPTGETSWIYAISPVWCGGHSATMCQNCPWTPNDNIRSGWAGAGWCNGNCVWDYASSTCNPPPSPPPSPPLSPPHPPAPPLLPPSVWNCDNKPPYSGNCPNYYGCHYSTTVPHGGAHKIISQCSCLAYCDYDSRCCLPAPSPPMSPPSPPPGCGDTCNFANDGDCDDGGIGAEYVACGLLGSDCADCGIRSNVIDAMLPFPPPPSPPNVRARVKLTLTAHCFNLTQPGSHESRGHRPHRCRRPHRHHQTHRRLHLQAQCLPSRRPQAPCLPYLRLHQDS